MFFSIKFKSYIRIFCINVKVTCDFAFGVLRLKLTVYFRNAYIIVCINYDSFTMSVGDGRFLCQSY